MAETLTDNERDLIVDALERHSTEIARLLAEADREFDILDGVPGLEGSAAALHDLLGVIRAECKSLTDLADRLYGRRVVLLTPEEYAPIPQVQP